MLLTFFACFTGSGDTGTTTSTSTSTSTTVTATVDGCPLVHEPLERSLCVHSSSGFATTGYGPHALSDTVQVVGPTADFSLPLVEGFRPCQAGTRAVELLDSSGESWVVGWELEGDADEASEAWLPAGSSVELVVYYAWLGYDEVSGVLLADDVGPLLLGERGGVLEGENRGYDLAVTPAQCVSAEAGSTQTYEEYRLRLTSGSDSVDLYTGSVATLGGTRELTVAAPYAAWMEGCADGCGYYEVLAWPAGAP